SIFVLLENAGEQKQAVLICDKNPFVEESDVIDEWVAGSTLKHIVDNDVYGSYELFLPEKFNAVKTTLIYPASEKHVQKYRRQPIRLLQETPEDYKRITLAYIKESALNLEWVYNVLDKKKEAERIVFEDEDKHDGFILAPDLKWNGVDVDNLYYQAIVHRRGLFSVRSLTADDLPMLESIRDKSAKVILEKHGVHKNQLKMFFHYQPSFYHLHVHIVHVKYEAPGLGVTSILLDTVIDNLRLVPDFYARATLPFIRKEGDPLYEKFAGAGRV
ncbi:m7GpppX diphosphatase, partial [Aphelenchoides avenae]